MESKAESFHCPGPIRKIISKMAKYEVRSKSYIIVILIQEALAARSKKKAKK